VVDLLIFFLVTVCVVVEMGEFGVEVGVRVGVEGAEDRL